MEKHHKALSLCQNTGQLFTNTTMMAKPSSTQYEVWLHELKKINNGSHKEITKTIAIQQARNNQ